MELEQAIEVMTDIDNNDISKVKQAIQDDMHAQVIGMIKARRKTIDTVETEGE